MQKVVGVKFKSNSKIYYFSANGNELKIGDNVIVDTANGNSLGTIAFEESEVDDKHIEEPLRNVLRVAQERDFARENELMKKASEAQPLIEDKIKKLNLAMKVVGVEYTFDGGKVIISFTAEGRVDFRELLKELASALHQRIELRQIGNRDEVKSIGGLGPCGLECCCTKFSGDCEHVSVKMAKMQGLSLSPTKINGLCGRLMCCLAYENETYNEILSRMPKLGSRVKTLDGTGTVVYNDILKEKVSVKIYGKDDSFSINIYDLDKVEVLPGQNNKNETSGNEDKKGDK